MGLLTEHLQDRQEQAAFAFFEHATALLGDDALREFIEVIKSDLPDREVGKVIGSRRSPEDRPGVQALLTALLTKFNVANFSDPQFDMACITLAAIIKAGLPDDAEYLATVAKHADSLSSNGRVTRPVQFYIDRMEEKGIISEDGSIDAQTFANLAGETGGYIGWAASTALTATTVAQIVGVDRGLTALGAGASYLSRASMIPGVRGKAASLALKGVNAVVNSSRTAQLLRLGSKLRLGNPWLMAALTVGGYATEYLLKEDEPEFTDDRPGNDSTVDVSEMTAIENDSEAGR